MTDDGLPGRAELERAFAALALCERFFPSEQLPPRSSAMLEDLFATS